MKGSPEDRRRSLGRARVRRHEEQAWARRSGKVFTHRVDPAQLRAEQVAQALAREPRVLELMKPEFRKLVLDQLQASGSDSS